MNTRRHPRFRVGSFKLNGQMTFASEVSVIDIGMGGVSVTADKRLNIGGKYLLKLEDDERSVSVTCEVAWARLSGTRKLSDGEAVPIYTAGMKFIGLSLESAAELLSVVEAVGHEELPRQDDRRSHPRFPAAVPGIALLDVPADYSVRTISLSGMLVECGQALAPEVRVPMILTLHDGPRIEFVGRVVSCGPVPGGPAGRHHVAIEFIDLTDIARGALATFIEDSFGPPPPDAHA
jgi:hypothetical protein